MPELWTILAEMPVVTVRLVQSAQARAWGEPGAGHAMELEGWEVVSAPLAHLLATQAVLLAHCLQPLPIQPR